MRICASFVAVFICVTLVGAFTVAMGFSSYLSCRHWARTKRTAQLDDSIAHTFVSSVWRSFRCFDRRWMQKAGCLRREGTTVDTKAWAIPSSNCFTPLASGLMACVRNTHVHLAQKTDCEGE